MSKKKNTKKVFMPKFPAMPHMPADFGWFGKKVDKEECKDKWGDFKSNVENFWDQMRDMQNSGMLNDTGAFIFENLQKGVTPDETAQALTREYDVTLDTASTDVQKTIASLIEAGVAET